MSRGYVPATIELLAAWHAAGGVPADAERVLADSDDEETEYDALMTAAVLAAELLGSAGGRRVVVVAETAGDGEGALPRRTWAAVHADTVERAGDADPEDDLAWFGVQEIPDLLRAP